MNKTAVEWLVEFLVIDITDPYYKTLFDKAIEMEKEQHCKTWAEGLFCHTGDLQAFHDYYNETYNNEQGE